MVLDVNVRRVALDVVTRVAFEGRRFSEAFEEKVRGLAVDARDRSLLHQIAAGAVRHGNTLDGLIEMHSSRPLAEIQHPVLAALRVGAYQLVYLTRVPPHAAVSETVEAVRAVRPSACSFTNAVLRSISASIDRKISATTPIGRPGTLIPIGDGWCRFNETVCPDQAVDFPGFFEACLSYPADLAALFICRFGMAHSFQVGRILNEPAPMYLRVNVRKCSPADFLDTLLKAGINAAPGGLDSSIRLDAPVDVTGIPGFNEGRFFVQDETAQKVGLAVSVPEGGSVLDMCAAPGGKATHIAELNPAATVLALDVDKARLLRLTENAARLGLDNVRALCRDGLSLDAGVYDAVLVDAPCSNTGVYRRKPDARWRFSVRMLENLRVLQDDLLSAAAERVAPGGALIYSTCSILPSENAERVERFCGEHAGFKIESVEETLPSSGGPDGGYYAVIRRFS